MRVGWGAGVVLALSLGACRCSQDAGAPDAGMLFDFKESREVSFWMRNTFIPLDMIFIRADGTIRRIAANTEPLSERSEPSGGPARYVLEVIGGTARKLGIEPGDKVTGAVMR